MWVDWENREMNTIKVVGCTYKVGDLKMEIFSVKLKRGGKF